MFIILITHIISQKDI